MAQFAGQMPRSKCRTCGEDIVVRSTRGAGSDGYCSKVCWSLKRFEKRYVGPRYSKHDLPKNILDKGKLPS